jgi:hypothetical protein
MGFIAAVYGLVCYVVFLGSFLYSIGFVGNLIVPKSIDSDPGVEVPEALVVNCVASITRRRTSRGGHSTASCATRSCWAS